MINLKAAKIATLIMGSIALAIGAIVLLAWGIGAILASDHPGIIMGTASIVILWTALYFAAKSEIKRQEGS